MAELANEGSAAVVPVDIGRFTARAARRRAVGTGSRFVAKRLVAAIAQLLAVTVVIFALTHVIPADPVAANLSVQAQEDPAIVNAYKVRYGLNKPVPVQYVDYMKGLLHGDFGTSIQTGDSVRSDLDAAIPASGELAIAAMLLVVLIGLTFGILLGIGALPRPVAAVLNTWSLLALSIPTFWLALLAYYFLFYKAGVVPGGGRLDAGVPPPPHVTGLYTVDALLNGDLWTFSDALKHLILPALVLATEPIALLMRFTAAAVREAAPSSLVRTGRGKGLRERKVVTRYIVRPALTSVVTVAGLLFGTLLSGTVLVESVLNWPGLGQYAYSSTLALDLPAIMGVCIVVAAIFIVVNFCVDVCYVLIDPRQRSSIR